MELCSYLVPGHDRSLGNKTCIRRDHHAGPHLVERENGKYEAWEPDSECTECDPPEECDCFVHWEVKEDEAERMRTER